MIEGCAFAHAESETWICGRARGRAQVEVGLSTQPNGNQFTYFCKSASGNPAGRRLPNQFPLHKQDPRKLNPWNTSRLSVGVVGNMAHPCLLACSLSFARFAGQVSRYYLELRAREDYMAQRQAGESPPPRPMGGFLSVSFKGILSKKTDLFWECI